MGKWKFLRAIKFLVFASLAVFLFGFVVMHLWNWLIPDIFNGPAITFIQALGILLLAKILFGFGRFGGGRRYFGRRHHWRKRFEERLSKMTPEEREKFKAQFKGRCGWEFPSQESEPDLQQS